jgi:hypothetical protein
MGFICHRFLAVVVQTWVWSKDAMFGFSVPLITSSIFFSRITVENHQGVHGCEIGSEEIVEVTMTSTITMSRPRISFKSCPDCPINHHHHLSAEGWTCWPIRQQLPKLKHYIFTGVVCRLKKFK